MYNRPEENETRQPVRKGSSGSLFLQCPTRGSKEGPYADVRDGNEKCGRISGRDRRICQVPVPELNAASSLTLSLSITG